MHTFRCTLKDIEYALEAVRIVKNEEDGNPVELATEEVLSRFLQIPQNIFLVTLIDAKVVGFATGFILNHIYDDKSEMFFYEIGTLRAYRRKGVGSSLIELLKQICIESNCDEMYVPTHRSNTPAMEMYRKAGGQEPKPNDDGVFLTWKF